MTRQTPETKTRQELIDQALRQAGWEEPPHSVTLEETITDGRIIPVGRKVKRVEQLRTDYGLPRYLSRQAESQSRIGQTPPDRHHCQARCAAAVDTRSGV